MIFYPPILKRGITLMPGLILIPQWAQHDAAYLAHEQCHAAQQRKHGVLRFWWLYLRNDLFRLMVEVEAYQVQIAHGADLRYCAWQLSGNYGLSVTVDEAAKLLRTDHG